MDSPGLKEIFPLVPAPGQCRSESTVLVRRKTGFRANRILSRYDKQTRFRFARCYGHAKKTRKSLHVSRIADAATWAGQCHLG